MIILFVFNLKILKCVSLIQCAKIKVPTTDLLCSSSPRSGYFHLLKLFTRVVSQAQTPKLAIYFQKVGLDQTSNLIYVYNKN